MTTRDKLDSACNILATSKWYRHFGVNYFFFVDSINKKSAKPASPTRVKKHFETLQDLRNYVMSTDICGLKKLARNTVFADGDPLNAKIMLIGEAPGETEDIKGLPFVGQSGQLLDNMLKSVGLQRSDTYITNIIFWRPPGNRTPSPEEMDLCLPYVEEHIRLVAPRVIMLLGGVAARALLNTNEGISRLREQHNLYENIPVIPTFHPAYLLRCPLQKTQSFKDMISLAEIVRSF